MLIFECPFCHNESRHPQDIKERYCPRCQVFVDDVLEATPSLCIAFAEAMERKAARDPERALILRHTAQVWRTAAARR